jgi:ankyrin repeat protein
MVLKVFSNSKSQYEFKLRLWGVRKNLKREQLEALLNQPDSITATDLTAFPGYVKEQPNIQRALKRLKRKSGVAVAPSHPLRGMATSLSDPFVQQISQATLAQELPAEQTHSVVWSPGRNGVSSPNSALLRLGEATTQFNPADFAGPYTSGFNDHMLFGSPFDLNCILGSQTYGDFSVDGGRDMPMFDSNLTFRSDWQIRATANADPLEANLMRRASPISSSQLHPGDGYFFEHQSEQAQLENHVSPPDHLDHLSTSAQLRTQNGALEGEILDCVISPCYAELLKGLPFAEFEEYLSSQNVIFTNESATHKPLGSSLSGGLALKLLGDFSYSRCQGMVQWPSQSQNFFQRLAKLLPGESTTLISEQQMTETRLIRMLLFSMTNGFGGLQSVSIGDILKSMGHMGVNKLLLHILQKAPPFVSRTLADNMLRAAIEAKDQRTVQLLSNHNLVDVNDTVCFGTGSTRNYKLTPVERAASLQAFKLVEMLVEAGADINKTHGEIRFCHGALEHLLSAAIGNRSYYSALRSEAITAEPDLIASLYFLIGKGANVPFRLLATHLRSFKSDAVICLISRKIQSTDHPKLFEPVSTYGIETTLESSLLCETARTVDDGTATIITQNIIEHCNKSGCSKCLETKQEELECATIEGAKRGLLKFVQLLLNHVPPTARVLSAAIKSGNERLIRLISDFNLELNPPAHHIYYGSSGTFHDIPFADTLLTSPLAEAVKAGNTKLVQRLECAGALNNLAEGHRLEVLILAAAEGGNMTYMESLLRRAATSANKYQPDWLPIRLALENDHDEVANVVLLAGADSPGYIHETQGTLAPALRKRNFDLVRSLLSADIGSSLSSKDIPKDVASWFNTSILSDLILVFPDLPTQIHYQGPFFPMIESSENTSTLQGICVQCMETDNVMFFKTFLESVSLTGFPWNSCLASAIRRCQSKMVELLLDYGASPFDDEVLEAATSDGVNMLPLIFGEGQKDRKVRKCIGAHILKFVMLENPSNEKVLDDLLEGGMVNLVAAEKPNTLSVEMFTPLGLAIVGLSGFCKTNFGAVKRLLRAGSDPDGIARIQALTRSRVGQTALMLALETGREDLVRLLVEEHQADVRKQTRLIIKQTPLQYAAKLGSLEMAQLLMNLGADVNEEPAIRSGGTALQYAAISGNCNMAAELLDKGAQLHALPSKVNGRWPLEGAAEYGRLDMIQFLWRANGFLGGTGFQERHCLRAMDFARRNGHLGCRDLIASLSKITVDRLESDEYGVPWLAY